MNAGAVLQGLCTVRTCRGGERRALYDFSAMQSLKSQQLHAFAKWSARPRTTGSVSMFKSGRRWWVLRSPRSQGKHQGPCQKGTGQKVAIHYHLLLFSPEFLNSLLNTNSPIPASALLSAFRPG